MSLRGDIRMSPGGDIGRFRGFRSLPDKKAVPVPVVGPSLLQYPDFDEVIDHTADPLAAAIEEPAEKHLAGPALALRVGVDRQSGQDGSFIDADFRVMEPLG